MCIFHVMDIDLLTDIYLFTCIVIYRCVCVYVCVYTRDGYVSASPSLGLEPVGGQGYLGPALGRPWRCVPGGKLSEPTYLDAL